MSQKLLPSDAPILVIIGPSGAGKSTIVERLVYKNILALTPTWTDRPPRKDELGLEHVFVSKSKFDQLIGDNFFAHKPLQFFGLDYRYATPKIPLPPDSQIPVLMARIQAIPLVDALYPNRIIYQLEAPYESVKARLYKRRQAGDELGSRLTDYNDEIEKGRVVSSRIFENDGEVDHLLEEFIQALQVDFAIV